MTQQIDSGCLEFPVLVFSQGLLYHLRDREEMESCSYVALRNGWFAKMEIIDSTGGLYRVVSAEPNQTTRIWDKLFNRRVSCNILVRRKPVRPTLEGVRERVGKKLYTNFSAGGEVDALRRKIKDARSFAELVVAVPPAL